MKRHSSQQSHASSKNALISPGSAGEHHQHPLRHHVKPGRKTKIVLPRNNSSARNLAKLARHGSDAPKHARQRSHDGEQEIRLPGSLDESRPAMKRNLTSAHLPRNTSHTKLKKNLSHGQLARIGSGRNLQGLTAAKGPPSPGLKGKKKKRSIDTTYVEKDLHEQEMEIARQQQEAKKAPKRVGFAVGDGNDSSEEEDELQMEGSGLQEDEWTDQSASASPATTRQNTANNSRRPSATGEKLPDKSQLREAMNLRDLQLPNYQQTQAPQQSAVPSAPRPQAPEADGTPAASYESEGSDEEEPPSPRSLPHRPKGKDSQSPPPSEQIPPPHQSETSQPSALPTPKSPLQGAKERPNPFNKHLLSRNNHNPAPALVSNVSAMDETRSARGSPAASMRSSRSNIADQTPEQEGELVSRFIPSSSHPTTSSGGNTTMNTPQIGSYQTPENESSLVRHHRDRPVATSHAPTSPGSTISGPSGAATPAMLRSRTELRMANERAMAEIEGSGRPQMLIPAHKFDRRNESLKSYLHAALGNSGKRLGPETFEGRFSAVNAELKVIQRFGDPLADSLGRLGKGDGDSAKRFRALRTRKPEKKAGSGNVAISASKSAVRLNGHDGSPPGPSAKSASPAKSALLTSKSATNVMRGSGHAAGSDGKKGSSGRVKFSTSPPTTREAERAGGNEDLTGADAIARQMWDAASRRP